MTVAFLLFLIFLGVALVVNSFRSSTSTNEELLRFCVPQAQRRRTWMRAFGLIIAVGGVVMLIHLGIFSS